MLAWRQTPGGTAPRTACAGAVLGSRSGINFVDRDRRLLNSRRTQPLFKGNQLNKQAVAIRPRGKGVSRFTQHGGSTGNFNSGHVEVNATLDHFATRWALLQSCAGV